MALGATPGDIFLDVLGRGMKITVIGVVVGIAGAFSVATILSSVFVDIGTLAWLPTLGAALLLLLVAVAACYFPAVRATQVAPAVALRDE